MADRDQDELLTYYQAELSYLREMGREFARAHPKVAARLELSRDGSADPHVERLLEAFAFLTARIQRNLDQQFPEITQGLLDILAPQQLAPIPSMSIARFDVAPDQGKLTTGHVIPRHTSLVASAAESGGPEVRFRTSAPVTLWPLEVQSARVESTAQFDFLERHPGVVGLIRVSLGALELDLDELELDTLRFYLNGELRASCDLYELLFAHLRDVVVLRGDEATPVFLGHDAIRPVGFEPDDALVPVPDSSHPGYGLLQEYFTFPRKYLFADVVGLDRARLAGTGFELLFLLDRVPGSDLMIGDDTFQLGCAPVVNLFRRTTDPLRIDQRRSEYRLTPDIHREASTEIHSILSVTTTSDPRNDLSVVKPYYSLDHHDIEHDQRAFWYARRVASRRREVPGSEIMLSFVDLDFDPAEPGSSTVWAHTLCTNRQLATQVPPGARLQVEAAAPLHGIQLLHQPTPQQDPPFRGETRWRLVSNLSLNHLSLQSGPEALQALRELLALHGQHDASTTRLQVEGIRSLETRRVTRRIGDEAWRGFAWGTEVTIQLDEGSFAGTNAFLFSSVLRHFLGLYTAINTFTELVVETTARPGEEWNRWPPLTGTRELL